ncbi:MAG: membrane protein insertion efficiency factor YidD [Clostridia bacterium]|nr:membrane protein insertion efficiency factor YidD [Clostridia bacterium]
MIREWPKKILISLVRFYQKAISPLKLPCCRFSPTCSKYAIEAIEVHGAIKGLGLAIWRVLRCNPFCKGGYDPVPPKKEKK